jgi:hypothetical protein
VVIFSISNFNDEFVFFNSSKTQLVCAKDRGLPRVPSL